MANKEAGFSRELFFTVLIWIFDLVEHSTHSFDLWAFTIIDEAYHFLLLRTSQEKADQWFGGGQFWHPPGGRMSPEASEYPMADILSATLQLYGLEPLSIFYADFAYAHFSRQLNGMETIPVFAGAVNFSDEIKINNQHESFEWLNAKDALERMAYRGHKEGLKSVLANVTGAAKPRPELRLA